jgi:hypothetical protein
MNSISFLFQSILLVVAEDEQVEKRFSCLLQKKLPLTIMWLKVNMIIMVVKSNFDLLYPAHESVKKE